jgi:hypothetical protein
MPHMWRWTTSASFIVLPPMTGRWFEALSAMRDELRMPAAASTPLEFLPIIKSGQDRNREGSVKAARLKSSRVRGDEDRRPA